MKVGGHVTPRPIYPQEKEAVAIKQETCLAQQPVWTGAESLAHIGLRSPDSPALSESLYLLNYLGLQIWTVSRRMKVKSTAA
jgi:hypothetical protein